METARLTALRMRAQRAHLHKKIRPSTKPKNYELVRKALSEYGFTRNKKS